MVELDLIQVGVATVAVLIVGIILGNLVLGKGDNEKKHDSKHHKLDEEKHAKATNSTSAAVAVAAAPVPSKAPAPAPAPSTDTIEVPKKEDIRKAKDAAKKLAKKNRKEAEKKRAAKEAKAKSDSVNAATAKSFGTSASGDAADEESDSDDDDSSTRAAGGKVPNSSSALPNKDMEPVGSHVTALSATSVDNSNDVDGWKVVEKNPAKRNKKLAKQEKANREIALKEAHVAKEASAAQAAIEADQEKLERQQAEAALLPPVPVVVEITKTVAVDPDKFGVVIGSKGVNKIGIQDATNTEIRLPKVADMELEPGQLVDVQIVGVDDKEVNAALRAVKDLATKGYTSLLEGENFTEGSITVHSTFLPEIIGRGGGTLKSIQSTFGIRLNTPNVPRGTISSSCKIGIVGDRDKVRKGKDLIKELMRCHHTEVTHPGMAHLEMEVDPALHKYIIGAKGSEIKHIQQNFKVQVHIPNENSLHAGVVVVGTADDAQSAEAYIHKVIKKALAPKEEKPSEFDLQEAKRAEEEAAELEPWMQTYVRDPTLEQQSSLLVNSSSSLFNVTDAAFPTLE